MLENSKSEQNSDEYFQSYAELDVHHLMLNDNPRVLIYKRAIFNSKDAFKEKIIMDVGAGTGILSIFCAQAGAKKVYSVEASNLAKLTKEVVKENDFENVIEVIESKVEDIDPESFCKVDIIVSEWMGFFLLHEGMLDSIIVARDKFLKDGGILFPNLATIHIVPCQLSSFYNFWEDIHGVKMKSIGKMHRKSKSSRPEITIVKEKDLLSEDKCIVWLDLKCITSRELNSLAGDEYLFISRKDGRYQGVCLWFEVEFPDGSKLSTSPLNEPTHWKQAVIVFQNDFEVFKNEAIAFRLSLNRDELNLRRYNIELTMLDSTEVEHDIPCECNLTKCLITRTYIENSMTSDRS